MKVIKENDNKLLNRKDVVAHFVHEGVTKSRAEIKSELAKKYKADEKLIIVREIKTHYGNRNFDVTAMIYNDEKSLKLIANNHFIKRNETKKEEAEEASA